MARSAFKRPGHRRRKKKKNKNPNRAGAAGEEGAKVPRSMVFSRGSIGRTLRRLEADVRKMMMPHTAAKLKALPLSRCLLSFSPTAFISPA